MDLRSDIDDDDDAVSNELSDDMHGVMISFSPTHRDRDGERDTIR